MKIAHHPSEELLAKFATGALESAERLVVAVHVSLCRECRAFVSAIEHLGGEALEGAEPSALTKGSFEAVMSRIERQPAPQEAEYQPLDEDAELPKILRQCRIGKIRRVAPGVSMRPILLSDPGTARAFLLRSAPGTKMLEHSHTGTELTCVLKGSFSHQGGSYGPGDFDFGDHAVDHQPIVGPDEACLCLVAMTGNLRMNGFFGRLIEPFVRL